MAAVKSRRLAQPELLGRLRKGANPFGGSGASRFLQLLGDGSHHFIKYNAVGEAEHLDVTDVGVTIKSLASIRFPGGASFWEWEPNGTERLPPLSESRVPTRCGFLVIADGTGQRGILHYADFRPGEKVLGRFMAPVYPVSVRFDLRDNCNAPPSALLTDDERVYAQHPELPLDELTAFDTETSARDAAAFMRHFGFIPSPLYKNDPVSCFPQDTAAFTATNWELFRNLADDLIHEVTPFMCMQLLIRAPHIRTWRTSSGKKRGRSPVTFYDTEALSC